MVEQSMAGGRVRATGQRGAAVPELYSGRVLVVEDDRMLAELICQLLDRSGFAVRTAHDGERALSLYREEPPDCIVLDVLLPRLDGWGVLRTIRASDHLTQVIVLTELGSAERRVEGLELGADDYLPKPFAPGELLARVRARTSARQRIRELQVAKDSAVRDVVRRYAETIPHELNQPLSIIVGYGELMQDVRTTPGEMREMAATMVEAGKELAELVKKFGQLRQFRARRFGGADMVDLNVDLDPNEEPAR
ncbi:MAG: response regulator [Chloroflexi bacterium]|nr:response regulator [Chloroflexota bacterium]